MGTVVTVYDCKTSGNGKPAPREDSGKIAGRCREDSGKEAGREVKEDTKKERTIGFAVPKIEEVTAYCLERNRGVNPEKFWNFYEAKGWMVGKNKMKSWKAAVHTWEDPKPESRIMTPEQEANWSPYGKYE